MSNTSYFAGANSENGFVSFYSSIDSDSENCAVYNIIGGPGTGKSSLMKKIADITENNGCKCERYFCSSDPGSLDAILVASSDEKRKIVVCDATAPHPHELSTPGAVGRIADLTRFWNCELLMKRKDEIMELQRGKSFAYRSAYGYLKIAGAVFREAVKERKRQLELSGILRSLEKYRSDIDRKPHVYRPIRAISMFGEKVLDNNGYNAYNRYRIKDQFDSAIINEALLSISGEAFCAPNPVVNSFCDEVYVPSVGVCFSLADKNAPSEISLDRFRIIDASGIYRMLTESYNEYIKLAIQALEKAKDRHFELEKIYGAAMDFEAKAENDERIMKDVSSLLE